MHSERLKQLRYRLRKQHINNYILLSDVRPRLSGGVFVARIFYAKRGVSGTTACRGLPHFLRPFLQKLKKDFIFSSTAATCFFFLICYNVLKPSSRKVIMRDIGC